MYFNRPL